MPMTTSIGSPVEVTVSQSPSPILTNTEISTYHPSVSSGIVSRHCASPLSITSLSCPATVSEMSFTSILTSMFSPSFTSCICSGDNTVLANTTVSVTPALHFPSSQTTLTVTVPFPTSNIVAVFWFSVRFPVSTVSPDMAILPLSTGACTVCAVLSSVCCTVPVCAAFSSGCCTLSSRAVPPSACCPAVILAESMPSCCAVALLSCPAPCPGLLPSCFGVCARAVFQDRPLSRQPAGVTSPVLLSAG